MYNKAVAIINEVRKAVVGKDEIIAKILMAILAQGHILLEDCPGVGKTTMVLAFQRHSIYHTSVYNLRLKFFQVMLLVIPL